VVISFGSRTNFGLTLETNVALTVENRLACVPLGSVFNIRCRGRTQTHKEKGRVQVLVVLPRVFQIKLSRFPTVHGVEAGTRVTGPQRIEGSFGDAVTKQGQRTFPGRTGQLLAPCTSTVPRNTQRLSHSVSIVLTTCSMYTTLVFYTGDLPRVP